VIYANKSPNIIGNITTIFGGDMQQTAQSAVCPKCGSADAQKVKYTWWGGFLGPSMFSLVKCNSCGTQYNSKTGKPAQTAILIYLLVSFVLAFCVCGGFAAFSAFLNSQ